MEIIKLIVDVIKILVALIKIVLTIVDSLKQRKEK